MARKIITAQFPDSRCWQCKASIPKGSEFEYDPDGERGKRARCLSCAKPKPRIGLFPEDFQPTLRPTHSDPIEKAPLDRTPPAGFEPLDIDAVVDAVLAKVDRDEMEAAATAAAIAAALAEVRNLTPKRVEIVRPDVAPVIIERAHYQTPRLAALVGRRQHCYLFGPPGSFKSTAAQQIADALGLPFYTLSLNPQSPASIVTGYGDAQGRYVPSDFYHAFKDGGVMLFDELDNTSPALLTMLNTALANGHASFPVVGRVEVSPDFVFIGAGNTAGRGGDSNHKDRRALDTATLDRLAFVPWGYDEPLERAITADINADAADWCAWVQGVRAWLATPSSGVKGVLATPRASFCGAADLAALPADTMNLNDIAQAYIFKGADLETERRILAACPLPADPRTVREVRAA